MSKNQHSNYLFMKKCFVDFNFFINTTPGSRIPLVMVRLLVDNAEARVDVSNGVPYWCFHLWLT